MRARAPHSPSPCLPLAHEAAIEAAQHRPISLPHRTAAAFTAEGRNRTGIDPRSGLQQEGATSEINTREQERRQGRSREGGRTTGRLPSTRCRWPRHQPGSTTTAALTYHPGSPGYAPRDTSICRVSRVPCIAFRVIDRTVRYYGDPGSYCRILHRIAKQQQYQLRYRYRYYGTAVEPSGCVSLSYRKWKCMWADGTVHRIYIVLCMNAPPGSKCASPAHHFASPAPPPAGEAKPICLYYEYTEYSRAIVSLIALKVGWRPGESWVSTK